MINVFEQKITIIMFCLATIIVIACHTVNAAENGIVSDTDQSVVFSCR